MSRRQDRPGIARGGSRPGRIHRVAGVVSDAESGARRTPRHIDDRHWHSRVRLRSRAVPRGGAPRSPLRSSPGATATASPAPPPFLGGMNVGQWRPTPPGFLPGAVRNSRMTMGHHDPGQFHPAGPPALNSARYTFDFNETKTMVPPVRSMHDRRSPRGSGRPARPAISGTTSPSN